MASVSERLRSKIIGQLGLQLHSTNEKLDALLGQ
jgi:hypothetical protein